MNRGRRRCEERRPQWAARSIGRPVCEFLQRRPFQARVLAVFERALDLVTPEGEVLALVTPEVGDGPLHAVVEPRGRVETAPFRAIAPGLPATLCGEELRVGGWSVALDEAVVWEPRPDWAALRARREVMKVRVAEMRTALAPAEPWRWP